MPFNIRVTVYENRASERAKNYRPFRLEPLVNVATGTTVAPTTTTTTTQMFNDTDDDDEDDDADDD